jgi:hypothetical protein
MIELLNIPFPPSNNSIYASGRFNGITRRYHSKKAKEYVKEFKTWAILNAKELKQARELIATGRDLTLFIEYHTNWKNKDETRKKKDVFNYDKLMIDLLFFNLGCDDSAVKNVVMCKKQSFSDYVEIEIHVSKE